MWKSVLALLVASIGASGATQAASGYPYEYALGPLEAR